MREAIGSSLRRVRTARRRTLREVSRRARVSLGYLSEVERGRKEASSELLASICEALDIALPELLTEAAQELATAALEVVGRSRRPVGLRHTDLRLAGEAEPLSTAAPVAMPPVPQPGTRPQPVARVAA
ncbi:helix-turn-helix transcriptional regulator [Pseudonocardia sp.]|uniref:helix-turn-helix domain-containing protein n=1 Tax=Pseudonocardia sp. TaxID=60912 RepID=UPI00262E7B54|nr:helix-turn-helix transcriptional regulator [Pseudonocardia sp.]